MDKQRLYFVDEARGLAMLVVVSWHTLGIHSPWTDSWVMPIFFFIMGLFYRQNPSFKQTVDKKINTLLVPFVFCSVPAVLISLYNDGGIATLRKLANPYGCINPCSWFLVCTFLCYAIYWCINRVTADVRKRCCLSLAVSLLGFYSSQMQIAGHRIVLPFFISTALTMMVFIELGRLSKDYILTEFHRGGYFVLALLTLLFGFLTIVFPPAPQDMIWSEYGTDHYILWLTIGYVGLAWVIRVCLLFERILRWASVIGRLSMLLLILHMYIYQLINAFVDNAICDYVLTVVLTLAIAFVIDKYLPFVVGRKPIFKI